MELTISKLLDQNEPLIPAIAKKFHISLDGAREFLKLAIIDLVKSNYTLQISETLLVGPPELLQKVEQDVLAWTEADFDEEDLMILGYCKNIR